jgi:EAL domain-containing protein (putative c-di-GMP-specific phosphodiesterase class I)
VQLGAELRRAEDEGQMFLVYQPQIAIADGHIEGVEAQPRWRHPRLGVLGPEVFMPVAEQIGIVTQLGHWVLWAACRQGRAWLAAGVSPLRIGIKVSPLQFKTLVAFEADIAAALSAQGTPAPRLELELTDSMLMSASRAHAEVLDRLRQAGVTIVIGNFGVGYSSLEYLHRHPVNRIKIAGNFIAHIEALGGDAAVVKGSIGLAHELGIPLMADGVETRGQFELLKGWGCREMQGRHLAEPLTADLATQWLQQRGPPAP